MIKIVRFLSICAITLAFAAIASAQVYRSVDFPGATGTVLFGGPNPQGTSVGSYFDAAGVEHGFVLKGGVFASFDPPGSTSTTGSWINPQGAIVGAYADAGGVSHGFILNAGKYKTIDFPGAAGSVLNGLSPTGEMVGFSCEVASCLTGTSHSFAVSPAGVFTGFDPPGAVGGSSASCVNPSGVIVGDFTDSAGVSHGYALENGTFTTIDFPGSTSTSVGGNNPEGDIVGLYFDSAGVGHGYLLSKGNFTSFDFPGAIFTTAGGINPGGTIVGFYLDSTDGLHGFVRTR